MFAAESTAEIATDLMETQSADDVAESLYVDVDIVDRRLQICLHYGVWLPSSQQRE